MSRQLVLNRKCRTISFKFYSFYLYTKIIFCFPDDGKKPVKESRRQDPVMEYYLKN